MKKIYGGLTTEEALDIADRTEHLRPGLRNDVDNALLILAKEYRQVRAALIEMTKERGAYLKAKQ